MTLSRWQRVGATRLQRCRVFDVDLVRYARAPGEPPREFYVVDAPDWINVVPITDAGEVVLVRQFRVGLDDLTLETPGGVCEPGEDAAATARREMLEETGYDADAILPLAVIHPNPALQGNRLHVFAARGAHRVAEPRPDADEALEVVLVPLADIPRRIAQGEVTHALVIAAFHLLTLLDSPP